MNVTTTMILDNLTDADFKYLGASENKIIENVLETAGEAILRLEALRWERFIHFCQTGRFE